MVVNTEKMNKFKAAAKSDESELAAPQEGVEFAKLPWNLNLPDHHYYVHLTTDPESGWTLEHYDPKTDGGILTDVTDGEYKSLKHYGQSPLPLFPSTTSLNYGTTIWEGLACRRSPTTGKALLFRPQMNYARFARGAHAMCLPPPSYELFMRGLQMVVQNNMHMCPPAPELDPDTGVPLGGAKLYVRPMLLGSGQQLGLHASPQISMVFFVSPTGSYFQGKAMGGLKLHLETRKSRAARGGTGNIKCSGNYAVTMRPLMDAKEHGFHDNLYLELDTYHNPKPSSPLSPLRQAILQELSAANIFLVLESGEIVTPCLSRGTILPGVTRDSVLEMARIFKDELQPIMAKSVGNEDIEVTVSERDVCVEDLNSAVEVFVTGTAAEVVPVQSIGTSADDEELFSVKFPHGESEPGPVTYKLLEMLREVVAGQRTNEKIQDWLCDAHATPEDFRKGGI